MSTTKHTPTPWIMNGRLIQGPKLNFIASTSHCGQEQNEANAEFIVRACNSHEQLLEACKIFQSAPKRLTSDVTVQVSIPRSALKLFTAVIAAAESR